MRRNPILAALVPLLDDPDPAVRGNAALALAHFAAAKKAIERLASSDDDSHVRAAAKHALAATAPPADNLATVNASGPA